MGVLHVEKIPSMGEVWIFSGTTHCIKGKHRSVISTFLKTNNPERLQRCNFLVTYPALLDNVVWVATRKTSALQEIHDIIFGYILFIQKILVFLGTNHSSQGNLIFLNLPRT